MPQSDETPLIDLTDRARPLRGADLAALRRHDERVRVIDVRSPGEFEHRHIPGSWNVPLDLLGEHREQLVSALAGPTVLVCESGARAATAEQHLRDAGLRSLHVLDGGLSAWERQGGEVRYGTPRWSLERQIRLVAGAIVALSVLTSIVWDPARFLAGAVGLGLTVAALTNTCAMGALLARLPYNRGEGSCDMVAIVAGLTEQTSEPGEPGDEEATP